MIDGNIILRKKVSFYLNDSEILYQFQGQRQRMEAKINYKLMPIMNSYLGKVF
jgi:hypothetical protein